MDKKEKLTTLGLILLLALVLAAAAWLQPALLPNAQLRRPTDFYLEVAAGNVLNHSAINVVGLNPIIVAAGEEDIWDGGGIWNEPTATQVYTFTSTSANDDAIGGTGARTMTVFGLDGDGFLTNETIALEGNGVATSVSEYQIIHRMIVNTAGISGTNQGTITANATADGTVTAQVNPGNNQTLMSIFKVPAGRQGCLTAVYMSFYKASGAPAAGSVLLYAKPDGEVWQKNSVIGLAETGTSAMRHDYRPPVCFASLTTIKMAADTFTDDTIASVDFDMVVLP